MRGHGKMRDWTTAMLVEGRRAENLRMVENGRRQALRSLLQTPIDGDQVADRFEKLFWERT